MKTALAVQPFQIFISFYLRIGVAAVASIDQHITFVFQGFHSIFTGRQNSLIRLYSFLRNYILLNHSWGICPLLRTGFHKAHNVAALDIGIVVENNVILVAFSMKGQALVCFGRNVTSKLLCLQINRCARSTQLLLLFGIQYIILFCACRVSFSNLIIINIYFDCSRNFYTLF